MIINPPLSASGFLGLKDIRIIIDNALVCIVNRSNYFDNN